MNSIGGQLTSDRALAKIIMINILPTDKGLAFIIVFSDIIHYNFLSSRLWPFNPIICSANQKLQITV